MVSMDEDPFRKYLRKNKKSKSAIESIVQIVGEYEGYLLGEGIELSAAQIEDLEGFVLWIENALKEKANRRLWAVTIFYEYRNDEKLAKHAGSLRGKRIKPAPFKIAKFQGINQYYVKQFEKIGIENVEQMIQRGSTPDKRVRLAEETGVPIESVLELVKLSDLTRLGGVKSIRARLYHDSGMDTIEKIAQYDPVELKSLLVDWVEQSGFEGIAPLPKEAANVVKNAKRLPRLVVYD